MKVSVFTGPQINLSLMAKYHQNPVYVKGAEEEEYTQSIFGTHGFKHVDLQWAFGAGLTYEQYFVSMSGAWGMTRMKDGAGVLPRDLKRNIFAITLGYTF